MAIISGPASVATACAAPGPLPSASRAAVSVTAAVSDPAATCHCGVLSRDRAVTAPDSAQAKTRPKATASGAGMPALPEPRIPAAATTTVSSGSTTPVTARRAAVGPAAGMTRDASWAMPFTCATSPGSCACQRASIATFLVLAGCSSAASSARSPAPASPG